MYTFSELSFEMGFVTQWDFGFESVVIQYEPGKKQHVTHNHLKVVLEGQESRYTSIHQNVGPHWLHKLMFLSAGPL